MSIRALGTSVPTGALVLLVLTAAALAAPSTTAAAGVADTSDSQANAAAAAIASFEDPSAGLAGPRVAEPSWRDDFYTDNNDGVISMAAVGAPDGDGGESDEVIGTAPLVAMVAVLIGVVGVGAAVRRHSRGRRAGAAGSAGATSMSSGTSISSLSSASTAESSVAEARVMAGLGHGGGSRATHRNATPAGGPTALPFDPSEAGGGTTTELDYGRLHLDADYDAEYAGGAAAMDVTNV